MLFLVGYEIITIIIVSNQIDNEPRYKWTYECYWKNLNQNCNLSTIQGNGLERNGVNLKENNVGKI